jgi:hypothetical protein
MPINLFFSPIKMNTEIIYSLVILILCLMIYFKTREAYRLTKHKGIELFRYTFLFFGLAYASRLFLYFTIMNTAPIRHILRYGRTIMPVSSLLSAYFSTMAILYLIYSLVWKNIKTEHFLTIANTTALVIAVIAFASRSPILVSMIQLSLIGFMIIIIMNPQEKLKKKTHSKTLYLLIAIFWLLNLFVLEPRKLIPFELNILLQIISIGLFITIYYKVAKLIK